MAKKARKASDHLKRTGSRPKPVRRRLDPSRPRFVRKPARAQPPDQLEELWTDLDETLRRIGGNLAMVHRDTIRLKNLANGVRERALTWKDDHASKKLGGKS